MPNWDFVFPYDDRANEWLAENQYPHPPVEAVNRLPTTGDMKWALSKQGNLVLDYPEGDGDFYVYMHGQERFSIVIRGFNWDDDNAVPDESFSIRWMCELQCAVLISLAHRCGQLIMWPDTGDPAVIFQRGDDPELIYWLWLAATERESDSWESLFPQRYGVA